MFVKDRETNKPSHMQRLGWYSEAKQRNKGDKMKARERERNRKAARIRADVRVYIELAVAAPEDLSRTALASPPWPINVKLSGSREAIRLWKRKTH